MAKPLPVQIKQWYSGLHTNRAATNTPIRRVLGGAIPLNDTLIDGLNMEITPANTLARRPGWPKYCSTGYGTDVPKGITGATLSGNLFRLLDTDKKIYSFDTSNLTAIFTKAASSGQSYFKQVGNMLYFSDGAENMKWSGVADSNTGALATPTNNGIATPAAAPTISNLNLYDTVGTAQTLHAWVPGYTYSNTTSAAQNFFFLAPTGEVQWAVIAKGTTLSSSKTAPNWATNFGIFGSTTIDGEMLWTNCGPIGTWVANTVYQNAAYVATHPLSATSTSATITTTGGVTNFAWQPTTGPQNPWGTAAGFANSAGLTGNTDFLKIEGLGFNIPAGATITGIEVDIYRGTNRANAVTDVTVQLLKAGVAAGSNKAKSGFWPSILAGAPSSVFYLVPGSGGIEQVYGSSTDLWGTTWTPTDINNSTFGVEIKANQANTLTTTGGITYVNGNPQTPVTFTVYYIAAASDIAGTIYAQIITDSNNNLQRVKTAGTSGGSAPSWATTIGGTTTDGGVTWECLGTANQLPALFGWSYGHSYHTSDLVTHTSTMSPLLTVSAPIIGTNVVLNGVGSPDTQCDRDDLYRTADGGSLLLYDTSATNVNGAVSWTDTATDQDLNFEIIGPVADANDPPPAGMTIIEYHMGRMWGFVGNNLYFSAGPDCINGDGNQAWPPANVFPMAASGSFLATTTQGLLVGTSDGQVSVVLGGPQKETFWVQPLMKNMSTLNQNCKTQDGDLVVMFTPNRQLFTLSSSGQDEIGFAVAPTISSTFSPSTSYVAIHRGGADQGIFLSDGSTNLLRYNLNAQSWDTIAQPVGGIGPLASIQTAAGTQSLLSTSNGFIVVRDPTTFQDSGSSYSGFATIGSITLSEPGAEEAASLKTIVLTSAAVGSALGVSVLPNEISGAFTAIPLKCQDPFGVPASSTINMNRYDWMGNQSALSNWIRHLQVKVTLPTENAKNEVFTLGMV